MSDPLHPRYGTINFSYIATWPDQPADEPMWALNLMHYRERADYADGRESTLTGWEADNLYSPLGPLAAVGADMVIVAIVVDQPAGDDVKWDRVAIVRYPYRNALAEMNARPDFQELHVHKDAGMKSTIVAATFPRADTIAADLTGIDAETLLLLQVVADPAMPDLDLPGAVRLATFDVEGVIIGDERTWAEARWDALPTTTAEEVRAAVAAQSAAGERYVVVLKPQLGDLPAAISGSRR
ncbi:MAG TPA: hypothetical protein VG708_14900 [Mycobacteriales bacterium]|nr:hypothetical protein [Mycobacteriales bacterium]